MASCEQCSYAISAPTVSDLRIVHVSDVRHDLFAGNLPLAQVTDGEWREADLDEPLPFLNRSYVGRYSDDAERRGYWQGGRRSGRTAYLEASAREQAQRVAEVQRRSAELERDVRGEAARRYNTDPEFHARAQAARNLAGSLLDAACLALVLAERNPATGERLRPPPTDEPVRLPPRAVLLKEELIDYVCQLAPDVDTDEITDQVRRYVSEIVAATTSPHPAPRKD